MGPGITPRRHRIAYVTAPTHHCRPVAPANLPLAAFVTRLTRVDRNNPLGLQSLLYGGFSLSRRRRGPERESGSMDSDMDAPATFGSSGCCPKSICLVEQAQVSFVSVRW